MTIDCDVAVIGAGTAGLAAEHAARTAGAKTILIDEHFAGTTCATVGCMPSKLLIAAANAAHNARAARMFGVTALPVIDGRTVMDRLRQKRDEFAEAARKSFDELPAGACLRGTARFTGRDTLQLSDGQDVRAKAIVIATGSRPSIPDAFKKPGRKILTNETVFELTELPRSLAVIGAGPLGLELAQGFSRLGVRVQVFDQSDHIAALKDEPVAKELQSVLAHEFAINLSVELEVVDARAPGSARIRWSGASTGEEEFDAILVAAGRPPDLSRLDLAATGLALDERGMPRFDSQTLQCEDSSIFMAGDADGDRPVLHEAAFEGSVAGRNAAMLPDVRRATRSPNFAIMFTDPPLAVVGSPPEDTSLTATVSFEDQGRAKVEGKAVGLGRIYADKKQGVITGCCLFGPGMDHVAHLFAWSIARKETAAALLKLPFYHPTLEEGVKPALRDLCMKVGSPEFDQLDQV